MGTKDFIITIVSAIGGMEAIKWAVHTWMHRKTEKRKQAAEASAAEMENYHKQVDWLQNRLQECYAQMEQLHRKLRENQVELEDWIIRFNTLDIALQEAERWSCNKWDCPGRQRNEFLKPNSHEKNG